MRPWSWALRTGSDDHCSSRPLPHPSRRVRGRGHPRGLRHRRARRRSAFVVGRLGSLVGTILGIGIGIGLDRRRRPLRATALGRRRRPIAAWSPARCSCARARIPLWVLDGMLVFADVVLALGGVHSAPLRTLLPAVYVCLGTGVFLIRRLRSSLLHLAASARELRVRALAGPGRAGAVHPAGSPSSRAVLISGLFLRWLVGRGHRRWPPPSTRPALEAVRPPTELERRARRRPRSSPACPTSCARRSTSSSGFADVLRDGLAGPLTDRQQGYVDDIAGSGRDLLRLVDELLDVTKVEAGDARPRPQPRRHRPTPSPTPSSSCGPRAREAGVDARPRPPARPGPRRRRRAAHPADRVEPARQRGEVHAPRRQRRRDGRPPTTTGSASSVHDTGPGHRARGPGAHLRAVRAGRRPPRRAAASAWRCAAASSRPTAAGSRSRASSGAGSTFTLRAAPAPRGRRPGRGVERRSPPSRVAWTELDQAILVPGSVRQPHGHGPGRASGSRTPPPRSSPVARAHHPGRRSRLRAGDRRRRGRGRARRRCSLGRTRRRPARTVRWTSSASFGTLAVSVGSARRRPVRRPHRPRLRLDVLATAALLSRAARRRAGRHGARVAYARRARGSTRPPRRARPLDRDRDARRRRRASSIGWVAGRLREVMSEALGARLAAEAARVAGRGGERPQERLPRQHLPRAVHAAQRHHRVHPGAPGRGHRPARPEAGRVPRRTSSSRASTCSR